MDGLVGWLDQLELKLSQLSTKLKLKLKLSLAIWIYWVILDYWSLWLMLDTMWTKQYLPILILIRQYLTKTVYVGQSWQYLNDITLYQYWYLLINIWQYLSLLFNIWPYWLLCINELMRQRKSQLIQLLEFWTIFGYILDNIRQYFRQYWAMIDNIGHWC